MGVLIDELSGLFYVFFGFLAFILVKRFSINSSTLDQYIASGPVQHRLTILRVFGSLTIEKKCSIVK